MIIYLLKMIACSALFYAFYFLILRNEKMMPFNRVYLLATLIASFFVPLITITIKPPAEMGTVIPLQVEETLWWQQVLIDAGITLVPLISIVLMIRAVKNLLKIRHTARQYPYVWFRGARIILIDQPVVVHSFFKNIFLSGEEFKSGHMEDEVLEHELAHVDQRHSWDILFVELLQTISWFNPFIYLYKRSIKINHELLADAAVIKKSGNIYGYQCILLQRAGAQPLQALASSFSFFITKKRLIMLQKKTNPVMIGLRAMLVLPLMALMIFIFGERVYAQVPPPPPPKDPVKTQALPDEVESLKIITPKGKPYAILKYKNGTTVKEAISGPQKQAFEKKYGVKVPPPPPPPPPAPKVEIKKIPAPAVEVITLVKNTPKKAVSPKIAPYKTSPGFIPPKIVKKEVHTLPVVERKDQ